MGPSASIKTATAHSRHIVCNFAVHTCFTHHSEEHGGRLLCHFLHCDGFLLASTSTLEMATKVQHSVAMSAADVDASTKPIT